MIGTCTTSLPRSPWRWLALTAFACACVIQGPPTTANNPLTWGAEEESIAEPPADATDARETRETRRPTRPGYVTLEYEGSEPAPAVEEDAESDDTLLSVAAAAPLADCSPCRVYVVRLDGEVEPALRHVINRAITTAVDEEYDILILDMDTFGGQLMAAIDIAESLSDAAIPTAVLINRKAISAGALISFGTKYIGMVRGSMIGASTPVSAGGGEMGDAMEAKINSVVLAEFRALAEQNGHPPDLAEAMVDRRKEVPGLVDDGELLTMTANEALEWKLAWTVAEDMEDFVAQLGAPQAEIHRQEINVYEVIARFFASSTVAGILFTLGLLCLYIEARTPGIGVPGVAGILFLGLFFFGNYIARLSGAAPIILVVLGITLLAIELFITPGFGLPGGLGMFCIMIGGVWSLLDVAPGSRAFTWPMLVEPTVVISLSVSAFLALAILFTLAMPRAASYTALTLSTVTSVEDGYVSSPARPGTMVGRTGRASTSLRPSGLAEIDGKAYNVVSDGRYLDRDTPLRVVRVEGSRIVVAPDEEMA